MRVLMLHNEYLPAGGETVSSRLEAAALSQVGVGVKYFETSNSELSNRSSVGQLRRVLSTRDGFNLVKDQLVKHKPDIVHAQNMFPLLGAGAIAAMSWAGVPWIRSLRNYRLRCLNGLHFREGQDCHLCRKSSRAWAGVVYGCYRGSGPSAAALLYARRERARSRAYPPAAYVAVSGYVASTLAPALDPRVPIYVKPNAVSGVRMRDFARGTSYIAYVGRLEISKGFDVVLDMIRSNTHARFVVVGSGEMADELEKLVACRPNLRWVPRCTPEEVLNILSAALCVLVPSRWQEPFGRVAAEALSVGTPPIVTARGGLTEIAQPVSQKCVVDVSEQDLTKGFEEAVAWIAAIPSAQYDILRARSRLMWEQHYTPEKTAAVLLDIYGHAISGSQLGSPASEN